MISLVIATEPGIAGNLVIPHRDGGWSLQLLILNDSTRGTSPGPDIHRIDRLMAPS